MLLIVPKYKLWLNFHPLGALYIAAVLKRKGENVSLLDGVICGTNYLRRISEELPTHSAAAISANIAQAYSGCKTAAFIRKHFPDKTIIWGGPYPSVEYRRLIPELADIVIIGEGEKQMESLAENRPLHEIRGIAYWDKNEKELKVNEPETLIEDLDSLPYPAWEFTAGNNYHAPGLSPYFTIVTERGCPFHCINCTKVIHGDKYRTRSISHVIGELEMLTEKFGAKEFHIWDDNFTLHPDRVKKLCNAIIEKGINRKARFILPNGIRADICDEEMFDLMRKANFQILIIAVESADQTVIDKLQKKLDLAKVRNTVETAVEKGFRVGLFFMMGLPFDTVESLKKTANFAASLPAHHAFFWRVVPFPGTKLYDMTKKDRQHNIADYTKGYVDYESPKFCYKHPDIPSWKIAFHIRRAYLKFYGNPVRVFRLLRKLHQEGVLKHDMLILFRCALGLLFRARR